MAASSPGLSPSPSLTGLASTQSNCTCNSNSSIVSTPFLTGPFQCVPYTSGQNPCQSTQMDPSRVKQDQLTSERNSNSVAESGNPFLDQFGFCMNRFDDEDDKYGVHRPHCETRHLSQVNDYCDAVNFDGMDHIYEPHKVHPDGENIDTKSMSCPLLPESFKTQGVKGNKNLGEEANTCNNGDECDAPPLYNMGCKNADPVDLENNGLLWFPPVPEDEKDERESVLFDDDDVEDATGEWGYLHSSNSFGSGEIPFRDRSNEEYLKSVVDGHFRALIAQLLQVGNLPVGEEDDKNNWLDIITSLSWEAGTLLKPDTSKGGGMDPGGYVKVKCIACGHHSERKWII